MGDRCTKGSTALKPQPNAGSGTVFKVLTRSQVILRSHISIHTHCQVCQDEGCHSQLEYASHICIMALRLNNPKLFLTKGYINGEWVDSKSGKTFDVVNPSTGESIATIPEMDAQDVSLASKHAAAAFKSWKTTSCKVRGKIIRKWADLMNENAADLGAIMTLENGKPYTEAKGEIGFAASYLEFYSGEAERAYGDVVPSSNTANRIFAIKQPIGVVACLAPWNFPAAMITRKAGGAIAAGCTTVVKPAGETPLTALAIAYLGEQAGIPKGVLNVITSLENLAAVGRALCELSFTGSTAVGKLLMQQSASTLKKMSLELGGNSPFIIFDDCDVQGAMNGSGTLDKLASVPIASTSSEASTRP